MVKTRSSSRKRPDVEPPSSPEPKPIIKFDAKESITLCFEPKAFPNPPNAPVRQRASLFRSFVLADYVTMANAVCGVSSIFLCLNYLDNDRHLNYLIGAFALLPCALGTFHLASLAPCACMKPKSHWTATLMSQSVVFEYSRGIFHLNAHLPHPPLLHRCLVFDIFDGWVARKRKSFSPWGSDLDSLADVISFVVTPAVLGFTLGLRGMWDSFILAFFVFCGVARLARYNVTSAMHGVGAKVPYYEGFPVPTSLFIVAMWAIAFYTDHVFGNIWGGNYKVLGRDFHPLSILYFVWGCLFVSASVRIPKP